MTHKQEPDPLVDYSLLKKLVVGIGEVSEITGVPTRKIRYWEEKGVITSENDGEGTTRRFDYLTVKKILLINELIEEGFTLDAAAKKGREQMKSLNQAFSDLTNPSSN